jgi:hypothetical protein
MDNIQKHNIYTNVSSSQTFRSYLLCLLLIHIDSSLEMKLSVTSLQMVSVIHNAYKNHKEMYTRAIVSSFNPLLIYMVSW